jgi:hypothetical protein
MNQWEQFEYILKKRLPEYKRFSELSLECTQPNHHFDSFNYVWRLSIKNSSGLYHEFVSLSKFCGINWEHQFWSVEGYTILEMSENYREPISPVFW